MKKEAKRSLLIAVCMLTAFVIWTVSVCFVDVKAIGPQDSIVGFATINGEIHNFFGVHIDLYVITDWLGLVPIAVAFGFAVLGFVQLINTGL